MIKCIIGLHPQGSRLTAPETLEISGDEGDKSVFCYLNEGDLWSPPKGGGSQRLNQPMANDLGQSDYAMRPP